MRRKKKAIALMQAWENVYDVIEQGDQETVDSISLVKEALLRDSCPRLAWYDPAHQFAAGGTYQSEPLRCGYEYGHSGPCSWYGLQVEAVTDNPQAFGMPNLERAGSTQSAESREAPATAAAASLENEPERINLAPAYRAIVERAIERRHIGKLRIAALDKAHDAKGDRVVAWKEYRDEYFAADKALDEAVDALAEKGGQP
jgi:hypothetical protein